ncbi:guanylate-binding protein 4-like [Dorcoceras hygrometricum]|uniref:Guanylate-binding protein 4-like n=1 Tax=Dorcoceras hygrometricum TaxID=472368 RepID=A0A2Z7APE4_9LAMI|nr:guanylate-binding protein 4-like [Dorcoceras hygrometricum]
MIKLWDLEVAFLASEVRPRADGRVVSRAQMSSPDINLVSRLAESIDRSSPPEASNRENETPSLSELHRARILRIDQDEARKGRPNLGGGPSSSRPPSKEKRKAPAKKKERRKKCRHEERGTESIQKSIPEDPIKEPVGTSNKNPEQQSTEAPYTLLDASALSFVSRPSGSASLDFIRLLVPDQDFDQLKRTSDLGVFETAGLHFMQSLEWFGEAANRFSKAREEVTKTKHSMDGVLGHHNELMKQLEEIQTKENVDKESLSAELESSRGEVQALMAQMQTMETQIQSLEARAQCYEEESKLHLAEVEKLQEERANSWALKKEKFLKSREFNSLCIKKASMYFDKGFEGCLAQFRANGYSEEEHPASFLDVEQALADMSDDEELEDNSSGREEAPPS